MNRYLNRYKFLLSISFIVTPTEKGKEIQNQNINNIIQNNINNDERRKVCQMPVVFAVMSFGTLTTRAATNINYIHEQWKK